MRLIRDKYNNKTLETYLCLFTEIYELSKLPPPKDAYAFYCDCIMKKNSPFLEQMCGTNRLLLSLLEEGFNSDGFDASNPMTKVLYAKGKAKNLEPKI